MAFSALRTANGRLYNNFLPVTRSFSGSFVSRAEVAELADAHGSGPCTRKGVGVRVPSSAPAFFEFGTNTF
jgi:hypothetical protein